MGTSNSDLTLEELLADPITQLVMKSDNVVADDIRRIIQKVRERHARTGRSQAAADGRSSLHHIQILNGDRASGCCCSHYGTRSALAKLAEIS